jgi:Domain of unknown function (DUF4258)
MDDLTDKEVSRIIKESLEYGYFILSKHSRIQMSKRNYSVPDIKNILLNGTISKREVAKDHRCYTFKGNDLEGHPGEVVIELNAGARKLVIITVKGGVK